MLRTNDIPKMFPGPALRNVGFSPLRLGALLLAVAFVVGCSAQRRYQTLSVLFDGVPDPNAAALETVETAGDVAPVEPGARAEMLLALQGTTDVIHEPFALRQCSSCHTYSAKATAANGAFQFSSLIGISGSGSSLTEPERTLCVSCHTEYSAERARSEKLWLHGPVGAGACTYCHEPHRSPHPSLLRAEAAQPLCLQCHDGGLLAKNALHPAFADSNDCTECHNPHLGTSRFLN